MASLTTADRGTGSPYADLNFPHVFPHVFGGKAQGRGAGNTDKVVCCEVL